MFQRTEIRAVGRVVNDAADLSIRTVGKGRRRVKVLTFSLAVSNYSLKDAPTARRTASFYRVSAWDKDAETLARYLCKGKPLAVSGTLELKPYQSKKHAGITPLSAEVRMRPNGFEFIDSVRRPAQDAPLLSALPTLRQ
jgi:single-stranded DNA-binding protein